MKIKKLFKKKSFKLSLVFVSLVGMLASGGHSFAKYRDENYGGGNAGAARFMIDFDSMPELVSVAALGESDVGKVVAFLAYFTVTMEDCEVSVEYDLSLRLAATPIDDNKDTGIDESWNPSWNEVSKGNHKLENTSFVATTTPISLIKENQSYRKGTFNELTENNLYSSGKAYYGIGTKQGDNIKYDYQSTNLSSNQTLDIGKKISAKPGEIHYYSAVFFITITSGGVKVELEDSVMLYNMHVEQVGE